MTDVKQQNAHWHHDRLTQQNAHWHHDRCNTNKVRPGDNWNTTKCKLTPWQINTNKARPGINWNTTKCILTPWQINKNEARPGINWNTTNCTLTPWQINSNEARPGNNWNTTKCTLTPCQMEHKQGQARWSLKMRSYEILQLMPNATQRNASLQNTRVNNWIFNILLTAQGHLNRIKLCHKQLHM